jgi:uncharacterized protein
MTGAIHLPPSRRRLILFGRYPIPGKVKTRLIPVMGALGAAELHRCLAEKCLDTVLTCGGSTVPVEFYYTGTACSQVRKWLGPRPVRLYPQKGRGLGERMRNALFDAIDRGAEQAVLVGTDIPHMAPDHLEDAFDALNRFDLVLGPSEDGGYWLVGLRRKDDIFQGIQWESADVLEQTLAAAKKHGLSVHCIQTLNDMDTEADLKDGLPSHEWQRPYLSVIIPTLNEEINITAAIQSVQSTECELIVTDGGSTDRTTAIARDWGAKVITGVRGRAEQQNAGAAMAAGRVLLFLHADTLLPSDYGDQVFGTLMAHQVSAGAFQFRTDYDHWGIRIIEKIVHLRSTLLQMPYGDQALFMPKTTFEKAGGFPSVPIAEDLFLVRRLTRLGRIALAPGVAVASGRRWREIGIWRATLINYLIAIGCLAGVEPKKLAPLYRLWVKSPNLKME